MNNSKCKTCKWFDEKSGGTIRRGTIQQGKCRFKPPTAEGWPIVGENDWCSKWRLKVEKKEKVNGSS